MADNPIQQMQRRLYPPKYGTNMPTQGAPPVQLPPQVLGVPDMPRYNLPIQGILDGLTNLPAPGGPPMGGSPSDPGYWTPDRMAGANANMGAIGNGMAAAMMGGMGMNGGMGGGNYGTNMPTLGDIPPALLGILGDAIPPGMGAGGASPGGVTNAPTPGAPFPASPPMGAPPVGAPPGGIGVGDPGIAPPGMGAGPGSAGGSPGRMMPTRPRPTNPANPGGVGKPRGPAPGTNMPTIPGGGIKPPGALTPPAGPKVNQPAAPMRTRTR